MTRLWRDEEAVTVTLDEEDMPSAFVWHGRTHLVERIDTSWQVNADWWTDPDAVQGGALSRRYVRLLTRSGFLCDLYCDLLTQTWSLARIFD